MEGDASLAPSQIDKIAKLKPKMVKSARFNSPQLAAFR